MIIAFDTSCYTTSIALIAADGSLIADWRRLLVVKPGTRGLRQSEAVFQHLQNLPLLLEDIPSGEPVSAVAASVRPRPVAESYLPVFRVGASCGETLAHFFKVPFFGTSHQEGHIQAGLFLQERIDPEEPFLAWHISGGTTELLLVKPAQTGYQISIIGGSTDLHVGQFIDRIGVALGLEFPAGPELEKLAYPATPESKLPVAYSGLSISFSGPASAAERLIKAGVPGAIIARQVFECVLQSLLLVTREAVKEFRVSRVLLVGGVAANRIIRNGFHNIETDSNLKISFGKPEFSSDNAVGVGLLAHSFLRKGKSDG